MDKIREIIEEKKKKGEEKKPRYGIRKLSVGLISCMLGFVLCFSTPVFVNATEIESKDENIIQVRSAEDTENIHSVDFRDVENRTGDARTILVKEERANGIEPAIALADSRGTGNKDASGNTNVENPGYVKGYSFSDLQFKPEPMKDLALETNQIKFEMYGKHNIAASSTNWEIRLQIDERIASHITDIQVDPKKGPGSARRTLVRISDSLGRPTNIWKINYIRASGGLFAGAETTDTQTAPNGIITLDTNLKDILDEIGSDKLTSDRLLYRVYLVSHQDKDKIVSGIESSGYFDTKNNSTYDNLKVSPNNNDEFKHASIRATYEKPNKTTKDGSGNTGLNGAIVLDHKLTKEKNFAYGVTAKGTPWGLNFKIDPRLVPYTQGIELHRVSADKAVYNVDYNEGKKVADLSIEKRTDEAHKATYGQGYITDNDLKKLVDFSNASPRPIIVRYVVKLSKPLSEILADMKEVSQVEGNETFGDDFIFDAWLADVNKELINNTYGTGAYYLQDIDGDGTADDTEGQDGTSPYVGTPELKKVYDIDTTVKGQVFLHELAGAPNHTNTAKLVDKNGEILAEKEITTLKENGISKSGVVEFEFNGIDASKLIAKEELRIQVLSNGYNQMEEGKTTILEAPKAIEKKEVPQNSKLDAKEAIKNNKNLPEDAVYTWKKSPDTSVIADNIEGTVTVTIEDREFDVNVLFKVVENSAGKYIPSYDDLETTPETEVISKAPLFNRFDDEQPNNIGDEVDVTDVPLAQTNKFEIGTLDSKEGKATINEEGIVTFTPAKGVGEDAPATVEVPVTVNYADGSKDTVNVAIKVGKDVYEMNEDDQIPEGYHKVTLVLGIGTALKDQDAKTIFAVKDGKMLETLPELEATEGYKNAKWPDDASTTIIKGDKEFKASATELDSHKYNPQVTPIEKEHGAATTEDEIKEAVTVKGYPEDAAKKPEITVDDVKQIPDGNTAGEYNVDVTVTYPDGSEDHVKVSVTVKKEEVDNFLVTTKNPPKQIEGQKVADNTIVITANSSFTVKDVHDEGLDSGLSIDEDGNLIGTPNLKWGDKDSSTYEEQNVTLHAIVKSEKGSEKTVTISVAVQRDTDGDGKPDITDPDDDGDGFTDVEEIEKGSDPKDPHTIPMTDLVIPPTLSGLKNQSIKEGNAITPVKPEATEGSKVTVEGLTDGLTFENGTIQGTPKVKWNGAEETKDITITVKAEKEGATTIKTFVITVQRDTDGDGKPDIVDPDDDGDGFTDVEEIEKGSDPKDPHTIPMTDLVIPPTLSGLKNQSIKEGNAITPVKPEATEGAKVTVEGLTDGLTFESGTIQGTPKVKWNGAEETKDITITVKAEKEGATTIKTFVITVQRDTDGDGKPDITDPDDDGDGFTDVEEIEKGSDPKDPHTIPMIDLVIPPTLSGLKNQSIKEGNAITPVKPEATEGSKVTVEGLTDGLTFESGTIQGTPKVKWNGAEETKDITITVKVEKEGATTIKTFVITVQRDTDGDGKPDITDPDDDGDGFTDVEEIEKGSDPKDPNTIPMMNIRPGKPNKTPEAKPESQKNNVVNNKVNSHRNVITNTPKTGDISNISGYRSLAALAGSLLVLLGIKKRKEEEE